MRMTCTAIICLFVWLFLLLVVLFLGVSGVAYAPDEPRPSFYAPLAPQEPKTLTWLPGCEGQPLTCGQKQNEDGMGFRLVSLTEHEALLQSSDMNGKDLKVSISRVDFDRMFGGVWVMPLVPEQQHQEQKQ